MRASRRCWAAPVSSMKPMPPCTCMPSEAASTPASVPQALATGISRAARAGVAHQLVGGVQGEQPPPRASARMVHSMRRTSGWLTIGAAALLARRRRRRRRGGRRARPPPRPAWRRRGGRRSSWRTCCGRPRFSGADQFAPGVLEGEHGRSGWRGCRACAPARPRARRCGCRRAGISARRTGRCRRCRPGRRAGGRAPCAGCSRSIMVAVGDEDLLAGDALAVAVGHRSGAHAGRNRSRPRVRSGTSCRSSARPPSAAAGVPSGPRCRAFRAAGWRPG